MDDVRRAIKKIRELGSGFALVTVRHEEMVISVPIEFNRDHTEVLELAQESGFTTKELIRNKLGWPDSRIDKVLDLLLQEGMAWIDNKTEDKLMHYWFPSLALARHESK